jgi:siderophore synthetase component
MARAGTSCHPGRATRRPAVLEGVDDAPPKKITVEATDKDKEPTEVPNPAYGSWLARDQILLSYLLKSLSREVLIHVHRIEHSAGIWHAVGEMFAAQHQSKITNLRIALANTKKLGMTTSAFLVNMQSIADELAGAGHPVPDDEMVSYILAGLGSSYNSLVAAIGLIRSKLTLSKLFSHLLAYDERNAMLDNQPNGMFETSANAASRQYHPPPLWWFSRWPA